LGHGGDTGLFLERVEAYLTQSFVAGSFRSNTVFTDLRRLYLAPSTRDLAAQRRAAMALDVYQ
jgi:hypothetical protein